MSNFICSLRGMQELQGTRKKGNLQNERYLQASEGKRKASEEHLADTRHARRGMAVWRSLLTSRLLSLAWKRRKK